MPSKNQHLDKARDNENFPGDLDLALSHHVEWGVTALFYSAIHYVEAYLASSNIHSVDHRMRDDEIDRHPVLSSILEDFDELKNASSRARYQYGRITKQDFDEMKPHLNNVKNHILPRL